MLILSQSWCIPQVSCICEAGWNIEDCSLDDAALKQRQAVRASVINAMVNANTEMEVSESGLKQQSTALQQVAKGGEIDEATQVKCVECHLSTIMTIFMH